VLVECSDPTSGTEDGKITLRPMISGTLHDAVTMGAAEVVVNEEGLDLNLRVEGDTEANLLFVNAGTDCVGVRTNVPQYGSLEVKPTQNEPATGITLYDVSSVSCRMWIDANNVWQFTRGAGWNKGIAFKSSGHVGFGVGFMDEKVHISGNVKVVGQIYTPAVSLSSSSGEVSPDADGSNAFYITLDEDVTEFKAPSHPNSGYACEIEITQDAATPRTIVWDAAITWPEGQAHVMSTSTGEVDVVRLSYINATWRGSFERNHS